MLTLALYLPDIYVLTQAEPTSLDWILAVVFIFFATDGILQLLGLGRAYMRLDFKAFTCFKLF